MGFGGVCVMIGARSSDVTDTPGQRANRGAAFIRPWQVEGLAYWTPVRGDGTTAPESSQSLPALSERQLNLY